MKLRDYVSEEDKGAITTYNIVVTETNDDLANIPVFKEQTHLLQFDSGTQWSGPLFEFCKILSNVYGYDVCVDVEVKGQSLSNAVYNPNFKKYTGDPISVDITKDTEKAVESYMMGNASDWEDSE